MNDSNKQVCALLRLFQNNTAENIIHKIDSIIAKYDLENNMLTASRKPTEYHKNKYALLRNEYNETKEPILLYVLTMYSFCHQMRFNSNNEFNMPCGNGHFSKDLKNKIINSKIFFDKSNYIITNNDFRILKPCNLTKNDFVYLDPPYFNTIATYNEQGGWMEQDENDLYKLCEELDHNKIKFAISNVFSNKGKKNTKLIEWCDAKQWNIYHFKDFTYSACGKGNSKTDEVLIINYKKMLTK